MNNKFCVRKSVLVVIFICLLLVLTGFLTKTAINSKTTINSQAATKKIVGGTPVTDPNKWPFMVYLEFFDSACGGTLIDPKWVLTAAHCVDTSFRDTLVVKVGATKLNSSIIKKYNTLDSYIYDKTIKTTIGFSPIYRNDIALVKLKDPIYDVPTISLNNDPKLEKEGAVGVILGWGTTYDSRFAPGSNDLLQAAVPILSNDRANRKDWLNNNVLNPEIAAGFPNGGAGICSGDSGGPLLVWNGKKWVQVGIFAWSNSCGKAKKPFVSTRISFSGIQDNVEINFLKWIKDTIGQSYTGEGTFVGQNLSKQEMPEFTKNMFTR